jgi:hypothetical protein
MHRRKRSPQCNGQKLKLPSTVAIKHAILRLIVRDELKAQALAAPEEVLVANGRSAAEPLNGHRDSALNTVQCV